MGRAGIALLTVFWMGVLPAGAQVPQPFPGRPAPPKPAPAAPPVAAPSPSRPAPPAAETSTVETAPTEALLGIAVYPSAQFIASYDAGRGQRYYLYGSDLPFAALVKYYQNALKTKGTLVFDAPATHMFEVGRFREETMAFPPGVTIKDYTWNGGAGYLNPKKDGQPARFASIIQIVAAPPVAAR